MIKNLQLNEGEEIIFTVRKHPFVFWMRNVPLILFTILPIIFSPWIISFIEKITINSGILTFLALYIPLLALFLSLFFRNWTDYYFDVWVVTNERIFDVDQQGLFSRNTSVFRMEKIQDVTIEISGIIATFLKFGTVHIHTAGEKLDLTINHAKNPEEIKNRILRAHDIILDQVRRDVGV